MQELWDQALVDTVENGRTNRDKGKATGDMEMKQGRLLTSEEYKRLQDNLADAEYHNYQFAKRPKGGMMVSMGNLLVYTHPTGDPEYVLEVRESNDPDHVWVVNEIHQRMMEFEESGVSHVVQRKAFQGMARKGRASFRSRSGGVHAGGYSGGRANGTPGKNRSGMGRKVSHQGKNASRSVIPPRSRYFPGRLTRLWDRFYAKTQTQQYNPANFKTGEFTTMRIGDDVLVLKKRDGNAFGVSAHYGTNIGSSISSEMFAGKRFASRADALAWLDGLKNADGKPLLFKSDWEPTYQTMFQLRDYSSLSEREILAGADPNTFKNAGSREYLKRYQASLRELEKMHGIFRYQNNKAGRHCRPAL